LTEPRPADRAGAAGHRKKNDPEAILLTGPSADESVARQGARKGVTLRRLFLGPKITPPPLGALDLGQLAVPQTDLRVVDEIGEMAVMREAETVLGDRATKAGIVELCAPLLWRLPGCPKSWDPPRSLALTLRDPWPQPVSVIFVQDVYQKSTNDSSTRALCSRINALRQAFSMRGRQVSQSFTFSS
jgi:hypothetical protein